MQHLGKLFSSKFKTSTIKAGGDGCSIVDGKKCCGPICEMCGYFGNILRTYPSLLWQYTSYVPLPISAIYYIRTSLPAGGYYCNIQRSARLLLLKYTDQAPSDVCKIHVPSTRSKAVALQRTHGDRMSVCKIAQHSNVSIVSVQAGVKTLSLATHAGLRNVTLAARYQWSVITT